MARNITYIGHIIEKVTGFIVPNPLTVRYIKRLTDHQPTRIIYSKYMGQHWLKAVVEGIASIEKFFFSKPSLNRRNVNRIPEYNVDGFGHGLTSVKVN